MNDPYRRLADILARCDEAAELVARGREVFEADVLLRHAAKSTCHDWHVSSVPTFMTAAELR